jgi:hypothetical protein
MELVPHFKIFPKALLNGIANLPVLSSKLPPKFTHISELSRPDFIEVPKEDITRIYRKRYIRDRELLPGNCSQGNRFFNS